MAANNGPSSSLGSAAGYHSDQYRPTPHIIHSWWKLSQSHATCRQYRKAGLSSMVEDIFKSPSLEMISDVVFPRASALPDARLRWPKQRRTVSTPRYSSQP